MSEEAYKTAAKAAASAARRSLGLAAGGSMALGICGAMGSVLMYATALPPWAADEAFALKGFGSATEGVYAGVDDAAKQQQQQVLAAVGVAAASVMLPAAKRRA